jgi:hypothetical protein
MKLDRNTLLVLVVVFAAGWWTSSRPAPGPGPQDRPVLRWIAKAAKNLLWVAVFVEPAPPEPPAAVVKSRVDRDGFQILENGNTL